MPPRTREADDRLIAAYTEAALMINRELAQASPNRRAAILRRVGSILSQLDELSATYVTEQLPIHFKAGSSEAIASLRSMNFPEIDTTFGAIHQEAIDALVSDANLKFANTLEGVRREASSALSRAQKDQVIRQVVQDELSGNAGTAKSVKGVFADQGITAFRSPTRSWNLEDYAAMLTRTILAEAHNTGAMTRYVSNGVEFGEVIERSTAPDGVCQWMRGKIVWLGDRRLLPPFHPNCMGGVKPFLSKPENPIMSAEDPQIPEDVRKMLLKR